jgi:hypothetical protein
MAEARKSHIKVPNTWLDSLSVAINSQSLTYCIPNFSNTWLDSLSVAINSLSSIAFPILVLWLGLGKSK